MKPEQEKFDFFQIHFAEAKKEYPKYRKGVLNLLKEREQAIHIVRSAGNNDDVHKLLDEMQRDIRIVHSRLDKVYKKMSLVSKIVKKADCSFIEQSAKSAKLADHAVNAFMEWRNERRDFSDWLSNAITKWQSYEQAIFSLMQ